MSVCECVCMCSVCLCAREYVCVCVCVLFMGLKDGEVVEGACVEGVYGK